MNLVGEILPPTETAKAPTRNVAEHLRAVVSGLHFESGGRVIPQSLSIGMVTYPEDATDLTTLIGAADTALYQSKRRGKIGPPRSNAAEAESP